ncbi:MAG: hypothetical protein WAN10_19165 [Candidatus Acidiferrales bacterium]
MGGYECELDIVAFHPETKDLVQIEPSLDSDSWAKREERYRKKFEAGQKYIPELFMQLEPTAELRQIALFVYAGEGRPTVGGGRVMLIKDLMSQILENIRTRRVNAAAIPEQYPLLRTLQFAAQYWTVGDAPSKQIQTLT